jgi:hypothetical protein
MPHLNRTGAGPSRAAAGTALASLTPVRRLVILAALALSMMVPAAADAARKVPQSFVGVMFDGPLLNSDVDANAELDTMVGSGVESMRTVFAWDLAQQYESFDDVPLLDRDKYSDEGGVPTNWYYTDLLVYAAATRHMSELPIVLNAPRWAKRDPDKFESPPKGTAAYANFTAALARRYGPNGSFWAEHPEIPAQPIRHWQIWNEPSLTQFWSDQPFAQDYVALLGAARQAIKGVDPGAKIVLAGLPNKSWIALRQIYKAGGRGLFDIAAFHPFTSEVKGVRTILNRDRKVLDRNGDRRKPMWVTELSWTSAKGKTSQKFGNETTAKGQGKRLIGAYRMLVKERKRLRIQRAFWYTWLTKDTATDYPFDYAGLSRLGDGGSVVRKPAFKSFRYIALRLEGCKAKSGTADRCSR